MRIVEACQRAWRRITFRSDLENQQKATPRGEGSPKKGKSAKGQPGKKITFLEMP